MTKRAHSKNDRVLAIAPSSRGFGFAVMEGGDILVDWGVRSVTADKNADALRKAETMFFLYKPAVLVLEDASAKGSRRSRRVRDLTKEIVATASSRRMKVVLFSRDRVMRAFFEDGIASKHTIARILAMRFPDELERGLPHGHLRCCGAGGRRAIAAEMNPPFYTTLKTDGKLHAPQYPLSAHFWYCPSPRHLYCYAIIMMKSVNPIQSLECTHINRNSRDSSN